MKAQAYTASARVPDYRKPLGEPFELTGDYLADQLQYCTEIVLKMPDNSLLVYKKDES